MSGLKQTALNKLYFKKKCGCASVKGIPNAKLIEYEDAPHGLFVTHKERLNNDLIEFRRSKLVLLRLSSR